MTPPVFSRTLVRPLTAACQPACSPSCAPDAGRMRAGAGPARPRAFIGRPEVNVPWPAASRCAWPGLARARRSLAAGLRHRAGPGRRSGRRGTRAGWRPAGRAPPAGGAGRGLGGRARGVAEGRRGSRAPGVAGGAGARVCRRGSSGGGRRGPGTGERAAVLAVLELEETIKKEGPAACSTARSRACCGS